MRGSVRGAVVRAENGEPVAGATIVGSRRGLPAADEWSPYPRTPVSAQSDALGGFALDGLVEGDWVLRTRDSRGEVLGEATVRVFDNAFSDVTIAIRGAPAAPAGHDVERRVRSPRANSPGAVRGRVVNLYDGKAVQGATISVVSGEGSEPDEAPGTDEDGWFALDGLTEGEWMVRAIASGGETGTATVHVFNNSLSEVTIEVGVLPRPPRRGGSGRPPQRTERGMRGSVRGRVVRIDDRQPVPDATITVVSGAGPAPDIAPLTNQSGAFSLDGLPAGEWTLRAIGPEGETGDATVSVSAGSAADLTIYVSTSDIE
jgi:uncharacterized GH25 family protein